MRLNVEKVDPHYHIAPTILTLLHEEHGRNCFAIQQSSFDFLYASYLYQGLFLYQNISIHKTNLLFLLGTMQKNKIKINCFVN